MQEKVNQSTKNEIIEHLEKVTQVMDFSSFESFTTNDISNTLSISRNLTSHYLNDLFKSGKVVKINTRPVYYFDKSVLIEKYLIKEFQDEFYDLDEFVVYIEKNIKDNSVFDQLVGNESSLWEPIEKCKAAIEYPPNGIPLIIQGEVGTGKKTIANLCFRHAKRIHKINNTNQLFVINGILYKDKKNEEIKTNLVQIFDSCKDKDFLIVNNFDCIDLNIQYQILENWNKKKEENVYILLVIISSGSTVYDDFFEQNFKNYLTTTIPPLHSRTVSEKETFIYQTIEKEQLRIAKKILVSERALQLLIATAFSKNIQSLQKCIKDICINEFIKTKEKDKIYINVNTLPDEVLSNSVFMPEKKEIIYFDLDDLKKKAEYGKEKVLYRSVLDILENYFYNNLSYSESINKVYKLLDKYSEDMFFDEQVEYMRFKFIEKGLTDIFEKIGSMYNITFSDHFIQTVIRLIISLHSFSKGYRFSDKDLNVVDQYMNSFQKNTTFEFSIVKELSIHISYTLEIQLTTLESLIIGILLFNIEKEKSKLPIMAVIACHGYATASSIADTCNKMLNHYVFTAVDMPYDIEVKDVSKKIKNIIDYNQNRDVLILVDLGSLENVMQLFDKIPNVNLGIINNVSTNMSLLVGNEILKGSSVQDILKIAQKENSIKYKFIAKKELDDSIIFVSEMGGRTAEQVAQLFIDSFPKTINVSVKCYDVQKFLELYSKHAFKDNNILFVGTTVALDIKEYTIIPIEDIINFSNMEELKKRFSDYFLENEYQMFVDKLILNFSLQNVIESMTILNANKVMSSVKEMLDFLQGRLNRKFQAKTIIGLNIHICCLIERLIKKEMIETHINLDDFETRQKKFIEDVKYSFKGIKEQYHIDIPNSEIAYLYDYILHD